jgi:NAD(P)-dependent dehydrogenase (short-subunit alcohol dehydrogenase family)
METGLSGRAAVVSGGSKGIGRAIGYALAREGVNVALLARHEDEVKAAAAAIAADTGAAVVGMPTDITDTASLKRTVGLLKATPAFSTLNIIVNSAAGPITSLERQIEWSDDQWMSAIDVKTVGALRVLREFLPLLATDGSGRVINIAGASGLAVWNPAFCTGLTMPQ